MFWYLFYGLFFLFPYVRRIMHSMIPVAGMQLIRTIADYRYTENGDPKHHLGKSFSVSISQTRRAIYWSVPTWEAIVGEVKSEPLDRSRWPEPDLAQQLIDAYFTTDNLILPLLNRKIFQRNYNKGLWRTNDGFGKVCLLIFANAAKSVDDPRCYWYSGDQRSETEAFKNAELYRHSAGWRWVEAVAKTGRRWLSVPSLEDLQAFVVSKAKVCVTGEFQIDPRPALSSSPFFVSVAWCCPPYG